MKPKQLIDKYKQEYELEKQSPAYKARVAREKREKLERVVQVFGDKISEEQKAELRQLWLKLKKEGG